MESSRTATKRTLRWDCFVLLFSRSRMNMKLKGLWCLRQSNFCEVPDLIVWVFCLTLSNLSTTLATCGLCVTSATCTDICERLILNAVKITSTEKGTSILADVSISKIGKTLVQNNLERSSLEKKPLLFDSEELTPTLKAYNRSFKYLTFLGFHTLPIPSKHHQITRNLNSPT